MVFLSVLVSTTRRLDAVLQGALGMSVCPTSTSLRRLYKKGTVTLEVVEAPIVAQLRHLTGAPRSVGTLAGIGRSTEVRWQTLRNACLGSPSLPELHAREDVGSSEASRVVREIAVSSTSREAQASFLRQRALASGATTTAVPDVLRWQSIDLRLRPLRPGTSAVVFRCEDVDAKAESLTREGFAFQRLGFGGVTKGQLLLELPWKTGVEFRLCDRPETEAPFFEAHDSLKDAPDVLPELQSPFLDGQGHHVTRGRQEGDCWMEARAVLRRPTNFLRSNGGWSHWPSTVR
mmetsp:Transcript_27511/g.88882  ORF Transcript_27511/g.88882 Transcript_27511/m.88882 type:complete len:290 (+) Transcript_27511:153-1022(+)